MTQNIKDAANDERNGVGHNSLNRDPEAMRAACKAHLATILPLEKKRSDINEEIKSANQEFKAETGITLADFNAARRLATMENEDEQEKKMQNLKFVFDALSPGKQLDWIELESAAG